MAREMASFFGFDMPTAFAQFEEENEHVTVTEEAYHIHVKEVEGDVAHDRGRDSGQGKRIVRAHWHSSGDEKLKELVTQYGPVNWDRIAKKFEGKSCRLRWINHLDPGLNRSPFSKEEEELLLLAHRAHGPKWARIAGLFPGRTDNAVKNHYHVMMARRSRETRGRIASSTTSRSPAPPHVAIAAVINHHNSYGDGGANPQLGSPVDEAVAAAHAYGGGGSSGFANSAPPTYSAANLGTGGAAPGFYQTGYGVAPCATAPAPVAFAPSARSAFSTPSPAPAANEGDDKVNLPFFDLLGVGEA